LARTTSTDYTATSFLFHTPEISIAHSDIKHIKMVVEHINSVSISEVRADVKEIKSKNDSLVEVKPSFFGVSLNVRELIRRILSL
ncbi:hypothetical protein ACPV4X_26835, partial [Vibrio owensii]|uniref:hypothetical protein n=1 Tax=Vibrio owensii TaxID=696485 RepID=UPI0040676FDA